MEIRSIGREEFHRLYPYTEKMSAFIGEGAEWFTNDAGSVAGIITRHSIQPSWTYAVLTRDVLGEFHVTHVGTASNDRQMTREDCRLAMMAEEPAPKTDAKAPTSSTEEPPQYFPQPDKGSRSVVLMILASDIVTIAFVLLWLFHWR